MEWIERERERGNVLLYLFCGSRPGLEMIEMTSH